MIYFGIGNNIKPIIGKYYIFINREDGCSLLHIGLCIECDSGYKWAMKDVNDDKIYYPYCADVLDISNPMMSAEWVRTNKKFTL